MVIGCFAQGWTQHSIFYEKESCVVFFGGLSVVAAVGRLVDTSSFFQFKWHILRVKRLQFKSTLGNRRFKNLLSNRRR